ncbi:hypothetical protein D3C73_1028620 [compost metagenome]
MLGRRGWHILGVVDHFHFAAFLETVGTFQDNTVACRQAFGDHGVLAIAGADFQLADGDFLVAVQGIDERAVGAELDGGRWRQYDVLEGVCQQVDVDELVGEQRLIAVLVARLELQGAGCDVDLVVEAVQHAGGLQPGVATVPGFGR